MPAKSLFAIALSLLVGFAAAGLMERDAPASADATPAAAAGDLSFDRSLPLEERIRALEQAVSDERYARQLLQEELLYLTAELEGVTAGGARRTPGSAAEAPAARGEELRSSRSEREPEPADRAEALAAAGFSPDQAEWIARRESELQMAALQARYEAGHSGDMSEYWRSRGELTDTLREELGEADYERYLEANGRSTSVTVGSIIESSPAERAGLEPGDRITRYDGERVFGMTDLMRQTMAGEPGQQVVVDIVRDDLPMQVVMPRGPLGISGGRRYDGG